MIQTVEVAGPSSNFLILIPETFLPALSLLCPHPLLKYILINFFKKKLLHISSYDHFFINIGFIFSDLFFFFIFPWIPCPTLSFSVSYPPLSRPLTSYAIPFSTAPEIELV